MQSSCPVNRRAAPCLAHVMKQGCSAKGMSSDVPLVEEGHCLPCLGWHADTDGQHAAAMQTGLLIMKPCLNIEDGGEGGVGGEA